MKTVSLHILKYVVVVVSLLPLARCKQQANATTVYADTSATVDAVRVAPWQLLPVYKGKWVEVEGVYKYGFEMSALFRNKKTINPRKALWIDFDANPLINLQTKKRLFDNFGEFSNLNNKRIRVVGVFNNKDKGHLDAYYGAVKNIKRIEVLE